jgi:hypothetical protein
MPLPRRYQKSLNHRIVTDATIKRQLTAVRWQENCKIQELTAKDAKSAKEYRGK